jgi:hypothetical protein
MSKVPAKVVAYSKWSKGGKGEYPVRIVALEWQKGASAHRFSTQEEVKDGKNKENYITGRHFHTFDDALRDMLFRMKFYQENFSPKNVSHIPPGITILQK